MRWIAIISLISVVSFAQPKSVFNGLKPKIDSTGNYSFWVSGHFYGGSSNSTGFPANTLLGNLGMINESDASMIICLGDLFKDIKNDIPFYERSLFSSLKLPLFNAVGNHDISDNVYQENFGATYFWFRIKNDIHVILDTEEGSGSFGKVQKSMIQEVQDAAKNQPTFNIFFYGHRTVWKDSYDELENIMTDNTQSLTGNNFESEILPMITEMAKSSNVYWFSGSMGGEAPASFFYHKDQERNITYIATAIRALPRDAMLLVNSKQGEISFETISLTSKEVEELENYNLEYWETTSPDEPFNWRLLPLYIKQTIISWPFFYGCLSMLLLVVVIRYFRKRKRRTKPLS